MSKNPQKIDPRVIRTRNLLRDALIALIREKGFEAVKTQDITERATLNRATFYLHYRDKYDLLVKSMYDILGTLEDDISINIPEAVPHQLSADDIFKPLISVFEHFARYADFYRVMLCEAGVPSIIAEMQRYIEEIALRWMSRLQPDPSRRAVEPDMIVKFISTAYIGVVKWWLENARPHSAEHMAKQFMNLITFGAFRSLGVEIPITAP